MALIEIAHPSVRSELRQAAVARRYVPMSWQLPTEASRYPVEMEESVDFKGRPLFVRPLKSADTDRLMEFFYSHSPETVHGRYQYMKKSLSRDEALQLCTLDYQRRFALGVFRGNGEGHLVAVGRYTLNDKTGYAETALVVGEQFRRIGIARHLLQRLQEYAATQHIRGFSGVFERTNVAPIQMHRSLGHTLTFENGEARYLLTFESATDRAGRPPELRVPSEVEKVHGGA
jgi:GNAT superfamily N-acetyltransferase